MPTRRAILARLGTLGGQLLALLAAVLTMLLVDGMVSAERRHDFEEVARRLATHLETLTEQKKAQGAGIVLAGTSTRVREVASGELSPDAPEVMSLLRRAGTDLGIGQLFVVNRKGIIVAYYSRDGYSGTGRDIGARPYVAAALAGKPASYAAVGGTTRERGMYVASPIRADETPGAPIIGTMALKIGFAEIDALLARAEGHFVFVSPEGAIFAASEPESLFRVVGDSATVENVRNNGRTATLFDKEMPQQHDDVRFSNPVSVDVDWGDPEGAWRLLGVAKTRSGLGVAEGALVLVGAFAFFSLIEARFRNRRQRAEERANADRALADYSHKLERSAERKAQLAGFSMQFQQAPGVADLGRDFLAAIAEAIGARQASLYVPDFYDESVLTLVAAYAASGAGIPERIALGEGLLGQCAVERKPLTLERPPEAYWRIRTGLGEMCPAQVHIFPITRDDLLLGVVELAVGEALEGEAREFFDDLLSLLTLNLEIQRRKAKTEQRLEEALRQAGEGSSRS